MIIPMRCFNCGQMLSSKYRTYINLINSPILIKRENEKGVYYISSSNLEKWDKEEEVSIEDRNVIIQNTLNEIKVNYLLKPYQTGMHFLKNLNQ